MKKYFLILFLVVFMMPLIASASWWNPFSWKVFQKKEPAQQVQIEKQKTSEEKIVELQKQLDELKNQKDITGKKEIKNTVIAKKKTVVTNTLPEQAKKEAELKAKFAEQDARINKQRAEEEAKKTKEEEDRVYQENCENLLNKYNAELFKYKEGYSADLDRISEGMEKAKIYYKQKLLNVYGNDGLWNSVMAEMEDNSTKWGVLLKKVDDYWSSKKNEIDKIPLCVDY